MRIAGIEAGGTKFVCAIANEQGEILEKGVFKTTVPEETMKEVIEFFKDKEFEAMGVGSFGPIDPNINSETYGYITTTPKKGWNNYNMIGELKKHFDVPMSFDTDVNCGALGEMKYGVAKDVQNCVYITIGTGIGGGIVVDGKTVNGMLHPEIGHMIVRRHEDDIYEGNCIYHKDCLEGLAAGPAIEKRCGTKAQNLDKNDPVWNIEAYYIAQCITNLIMTVSPEKVILGGGVSKQEQIIPLVRKHVKNIVNGYIDTKELKDIDNFIVGTSLNDMAGLKGTFALVLDK